MGGSQSPFMPESKIKPSDMEMLKMTMGQATAATQINSATIKEYASQAIRGAFVLNGSAAVAVLAKQGGIGPGGGPVIGLCAAGAVCAVLCSGFSYLAQSSYAKHSMKIYDDILASIGGSEPNPKKPPIKGNILNYCSWILFLASIGLFGVALTKAIPLLG